MYSNLSPEELIGVRAHVSAVEEYSFNKWVAEGLPGGDPQRESQAYDEWLAAQEWLDEVNAVQLRMEVA